MYTWDEASQSWTTPSSLNSSLPAGQGFIVYLYTDDNPRLAGTQGGFPKNLYYSGAVNILPETISLSYTSGGTASLDGFNLVSNPSASPVNWDQMTRTNVSDTYYVWNPAGGNYATYQAGVGGTDGGSSIIAPFQGFWVQATGSGASLQIDSTATDTGGTLYAAPPSSNLQFGESMTKGTSNGASSSTQTTHLSTILLRLSKDGQSDEVRLVLRKGAKTGIDPYDAQHLSSLTNSYVSLSSQVDRASLSIDSRPVPQNSTVTMNLMAENVNEPGETDTLSLMQNNLPKGWTITLKNPATGMYHTLDSLGVTIRVKQLSMKNAGGGSVKTAGEAANWQIILTPPNLTAVNTNTPQKPMKLALRQNYPNPFNPTTIIRYALPKAGNVSLRVYNILGQLVETLVDRKEIAGYYQVHFDASQLVSGMYLYRLSTPTGTITKHMILLK